MLGIRKFLGCLVRLWLCAIQTICRTKQHGLDNREQRAAPDGASATDDQWNVDGWEDFSVKVVPNSGSSELPPEGSTSGPGEPAGTPNALQQDDDFFEDMKPVFHKPMKIHLRSTESEQQEANFTKFAVQDSVFRQEGVGELGVWSEDEGEDGWEDELAPDEGRVMQYSQETMKKKKAYEREKRRKAQEVLRTQQRTNSNSLRLGTRVT